MENHRSPKKKQKKEENGFDEESFSARGYQREVFEKAKAENIIAVLDTGISFIRILHFSC